MTQSVRSPLHAPSTIINEALLVASGWSNQSVRVFLRLTASLKHIDQSAAAAPLLLHEHFYSLHSRTARPAPSRTSSSPCVLRASDGAEQKERSSRAQQAETKTGGLLQRARSAEESKWSWGWGVGCGVSDIIWTLSLNKCAALK